jgi:hypothetical protein
MKTHVDNVHSHLLVKKKSLLSESAMVKLYGANHIWQHGKKRPRPTSFAITIFWGQQTLLKMVINHCKDFLKTL